MIFRGLRWVLAAGTLTALACSGPHERTPASPAPLPPTSAQSNPHPAPPKPGKITRLELDAFFQLQQNRGALVYDVRPAFHYHFSLGHIPGALNWPMSQYKAQLAAREAEMRAAAAAKRPVVLYCTDLTCQDSETVATRLAARGHSVAILLGGFDVWKTSGLPIEP